jgi:two-component sensor histidine kinase/tetratricopeptide (TPR) repeat protein
MNNLLFQCLFVLILASAASVTGEPIHSQMTSQKAESVKARLKFSKPDTNKVNKLLLLAEFYVYKQSATAQDFADAMKYGEEAQILSKKLNFVKGQIRALYILGDYYSRAEGKEKAFIRYAEGIELSRKTGDTNLEAEGLFYTGYVSEWYGEPKEKIYQYYKGSMDLFKSLKMTEKQAYLLKTIADFHGRNSEDVLALSELSEVLKLYQSVHYKKLHHTHSLIASIHRKTGNYTDALQHVFAAVESAKTSQDTLDLGILYFQYGAINAELNQYQQAIDHQKVAIGYFQRYGDNFNVMSCMRSTCGKLISLGKPREALEFCKQIARSDPPKSAYIRVQYDVTMFECYIALKQYDKAQQYVKELANLDGKAVLENDLIRLIIASALGKLYIATHQFDKAHWYLTDGLALNATSGRLRYAQDLQFLLFKADSAKGNFAEAITHYQVFKTINDSIFNEAKSKQVASLQIKYDTKKKEQDITFLTKQTQAQQASIKQKDFQRNTFLGGTIMLALLVGLIFNQYRIKQRANTQLQIQQNVITEKNVRQQHLLDEKEWLLKEIHHRVKNNLQMVMSLLESQSAFLKNDALAAIKDSQHRVQAMSLIHQKLYLSENVTTIHMPTYIQELVSYLRESFDTRQRIRFELELQPIDLDVAHAIPLGLILNEAITNAIKYAFPVQNDGIIRVSFVESEPAVFQLLVADNGIGLPPDFENMKASSLGSRLMRGLSNEIGGSLIMENGGGALVSLTFGVEKIFRPAEKIASEEKYEVQV